MPGFWLSDFFEALSTLTKMCRKCTYRVSAWNVASTHYGRRRRRGRRADGFLLAVQFADNCAPGTKWDIDSEYSRDSFSVIISGYNNNVIQPALMKNSMSMGATRVVLEVIIPSANGITAERWRQGATMCPVNWPTDYWAHFGRLLFISF